MKDSEIAKAIIDAGHSVMIGCFAIAAALSEGLTSSAFGLAVFLYVSIRLVWSAFNKAANEKEKSTKSTDTLN
ncbi:TPA: hypothetical protein RQK91_004195 [Vibrio vulnificus]|nr:hypothetical protein [Vibrio vulnificus]